MIPVHHHALRWLRVLLLVACAVACGLLVDRAFEDTRETPAPKPALKPCGDCDLCVGRLDR